jgi:hypothetical protein
MISEAFASSKGLFTFTYEKCFFCRTTQLGALIVSNDPKLCRTAQIQSHDQFCVNRPFKKANYYIFYETNYICNWGILQVQVDFWSQYDPNIPLLYQDYPKYYDPYQDTYRYQ